MIALQMPEPPGEEKSLTLMEITYFPEPFPNPFLSTNSVNNPALLPAVLLGKHSKYLDSLGQPKEFLCS